MGYRPTIDWFTLSGGSPQAGTVRRNPVAGAAAQQRYDWTETIPAGATRNLLGLSHSPFEDLVLFYQSTENSTESAELTITQGNTRVQMPIVVQVGPLGGGSIRLSGAVEITATARNQVAGVAEIQVWICPSAQVQQVPPISASLLNFAQGVPTFLSPDAGSRGWCPTNRPVLSIVSTQNLEIDFLDAGGGFGGRQTFNPSVANRELVLVHPPEYRLRVNNTSGANSGVIATWSRGAQ
tara:strand:- start:1 stop:714 length:714 start_codon:yes stop_codon:yes gene_type:complete